MALPHQTLWSWWVVLVPCNSQLGSEQILAQNIPEMLELDVKNSSAKL